MDTNLYICKIMKKNHTHFANQYLKIKSGIIVVLSVFILICLSSCISNRPAESDSAQGFRVRALWVDPPGFADRETVDRLIQKCQTSGINMLIPNIMLRENVYFQSKNFFGNVNANNDYDPLAYLIEKAHAAQIEVHPWSCVYYTKPKSADWVGMPFLSRNYEHQFLSAAHPDVTPYLVSVLEELLQYDIDGIHLDYTRYWNAAFDYSDAARKRFREAHGFDPGDFVNYPERIATAEEDPYPVRAFCPSTMEERVWESGALERTMNRTGLGFGYISESVRIVDQLRTPGMIVVSHYTEVSVDVMQAFQRYLDRGGDILWIYPEQSLADKSPEWVAMSGVMGIRSIKHGKQLLDPAPENSSLPVMEPFFANSTWGILETSQAEVIGTIGEGSPVISVHRKGKGSFITLGFRLIQNNEPQVMQFLRELILRNREDSGITGPDILAEKRQLWNDWRASHINDLVRQVSMMVKEKDPRLLVTAAAGVGPQQYFGVYRDGAYWLEENMCDVIFPMNYTGNIDDFRDILDEQVLFTTDNLSGRIYPGLQIYARTEGGAVPTDPELVREQLEIVKEYGYEGFCLFAFSYLSDEIIEVLADFQIGRAHV